MRMRVDAGFNPEQDIGRLAAAEGELIERLKLIEIIDDDLPDAVGERLGQFLNRLVVAMKKNAFRREICADRCVKLAAGNNVKPQSLLGRNFTGGLAAKRLARVGYKPAAAVIPFDGTAVAGACAPDFILVHDIKRRAVLLRERNRIAAADR